MKILEKAAYLSIASIFYLLSMIPRNISVVIANFLGRLWFALDRNHRVAAIENLNKAFGDKLSQSEIKGIALQSFKNLSLIIFELAWSLNLKEKDYNKYFRIEGLEKYQKASEKGKGILLLTGHMGNWELMTIVAAMTDIPVSDIYRPLEFEPLEKFVYKFRTRFGLKLIPKRNAVRQIFKNLGRGEGVAFMLDQNTLTWEGVIADFFGVPAWTNKGLALIALRTGAPVIPVFLVREGMKYKVEFGSEIPITNSGDRTKDIEENTAKFNKVIEDVICRYPDQWFWVHKRWKSVMYSKWPV